MISILLYLVSALAAFGYAAAIAAEQAVTHLSSRKATELDSSATTIIAGVYDIMPNPWGSLCGTTWPSYINVNTVPDQPRASPLCQYLYDFITILTSQGATNKNVDFVYICPPHVPVPTVPQGYGSRNIKFIVSGPTSFPGNHATFDANLQILDINTIPATNVNIPVKIGYYFNTKNQEKPGFEMLTFQNIYCVNNPDLT